jgi:anti-sigma regulatory factor (Ser/Thr protein kinase)
VAEDWRGIRLTLRSDIRFLEPVRTLIREATGLIGLDEDEADKVVLAVQEGAANVIRHCYKDIPHERIDIELAFHDDHLEIRLVDYGTFVDPDKIKGRALEDVRPGGLGVHLMQSVMDEVRYEKNDAGGTTLIMRKRIPESAEEGDFL